MTQKSEDGTIKPFSFLSGKFNTTSVNWSINDKELYSAVFAVKRYQHIIDNSSIIIHTDHKNLTYLEKPESRTTKGSSIVRIKRWNLFIMENNVQMIFIPGEDNVVADLLSRWSYPDLARSAHTDVIGLRPEKHLSRSMGWTRAETKQLRKLIQLYGMGAWMDILNSWMLPGKTVSQMVAKTIKMLGQQSIKQFQGMRIDPKLIRKLVVSKRKGYKEGEVMKGAGQAVKPDVMRMLEKHTNLFVEICPLKIEEISGNFTKKMTEPDKTRYLITLNNYNKELIRLIYLYNIIMDEERFYWYERYRFVIRDILHDKKTLRRWKLNRLKVVSKLLVKKRDAVDMKRFERMEEALGDVISRTKELAVTKKNN